MKKFIRSALAATILTVSGGVAGALFVNAAGAAGAPPWEPDTNAVGGIVFYNAAGQQITGGSLTDTPIAAYAQGSTVVRAGDTKATLYAYTPVINVAPGAWNGESLSSSTVYPNASAPASLAGSSLPLVTGQTSDTSLSSYIGDFPNNDTSTTDGYAGIYQLRLKTSAVGSSPLTTYDAVDIAVTGSTWAVVYPSATLNSTTTVLTESPLSPQTAGTSITLTATVSGGASGTVQFLDGECLENLSPTGCMGSESPSYQNMVSLPAIVCFGPQQTNVTHVMLGTGVRAAGEVDIDRTIQLKLLFEMFGQCDCVALRIGGGVFAVFVSRTGNHAACHIRLRGAESHGADRLLHCFDIGIRNIGDDEILPDSQTNLPRAVIVR